jgi:alditol oxidase
MSQRITNWAGNFTYHTSRIHYPKTIDEICQLVKQCKQVRALGSRHSFNTIADSSEDLISLEFMNAIVELDWLQHTITVEAGIKYGEVCEHLHHHGYALHNLASLPHISIAGAVATATHGSGIQNGNLATGVVALEFVNAAGDIIKLSRADGDIFNGAVVNLGALGIVTRITLELVPAFDVQQYVYLNLPMQQLEKNFIAIMSAGYSVSLFTKYQNKTINEVWVKKSFDIPVDIAPAEFYGAALATRNVHPIEEESAENCTDQLGISGPWYDRLPHFKMGFKPSSGKELQSEYFVPIEYAYEAFMAVESLRDQITPYLFVSEIRTIQADDLWMSPCYKRDCLAIHFTWHQEVDAVMKLLPLIEAKLAPFNPAPHWGKLFTLSPEKIAPRFERIADFEQLFKKYDPEGKFRNDFLRTILS